MRRPLISAAVALAVILGLFTAPALAAGVTSADVGTVRPLAVRWAEPQRALITDPAYVGSYIWVATEDPVRPAYPGPITTRWRIETPGGDTVLGPVDVAPDSRTFFTAGERAHGETSDTRLDAGDYTLVVTEVFGTSPEAQQTYQGSLPITYVDDPPAQAAPAPTRLQQDIYFADARDVTEAHWTIPAVGGNGLRGGHLVVTDRAGEVVDQQYIGVSTCVPASACDPSDPATQWKGTQYDVSWRGYGCPDGTGGCVQQPAGTYSASFLEPDEFGRPITVSLGDVRLYRASATERHVAVRFAPAKTVGRHTAALTMALPQTPMLNTISLDLRARTTLSRSLTRKVHRNWSKKVPFTIRMRVPGITSWTTADADAAQAVRTVHGWTAYSLLGEFSPSVDGRTIEIEVRSRSKHRLKLRALRADVMFWYWRLA